MNTLDAMAENNPSQKWFSFHVEAEDSFIAADGACPRIPCCLAGMLFVHEKEPISDCIMPIEVYLSLATVTSVIDNQQSSIQQSWHFFTL
ncbi:hypothetical protein M513_01496 [Trichuris suis]|uniref:Uncharacterized protein n=1 Tax=Trichuris suis TaxID=68888 RepID=A0A085MKT0_9BILA|nr:hypothetical protein M513_01496 [Trichuris suis]